MPDGEGGARLRPTAQRAPAARALWRGVEHGSRQTAGAAPDAGACAPVVSAGSHTLDCTCDPAAPTARVRRSPNVAFCGYSIPHPTEHVVNLRVQTTGAILPKPVRAVGTTRCWGAARQQQALRLRRLWLRTRKTCKAAAPRRAALCTACNATAAEH